METKSPEFDTRLPDPLNPEELTEVMKALIVEMKVAGIETKEDLGEWKKANRISE